PDHQISRLVPGTDRAVEAQSRILFLSFVLPPFLLRLVHTRAKTFRSLRVGSQHLEESVARCLILPKRRNRQPQHHQRDNSSRFHSSPAFTPLQPEFAFWLRKQRHSTPLSLLHGSRPNREAAHANHPTTRAFPN